MQRSELLFPHTQTHALSFSFIPRSIIPVIPDVLMLCSASPSSALLRQPEYMAMSSSPVLRTRCLTGQLDAYSFTEMYFQALSSSLPSPKKALCRPPSQHVRARARGNLGGKTRRRRFFWPATFLLCPSFLSSVFPFSHHPPTPPNPNTPTKTSLSLIPIPILSIQIQFQFQFQNSIHQPPHPQPRTNHTRPHDSNFSRKHPKPRPRTYYRPRLFSELLHSGVVCVCAEGDEDC